jgi:predicted XRE-type DNA-binding protein
MPSAKEINEPGHITTGNVLEDLGFSAQEIREMEIKHDLWVPIRAEIEARSYTQSQLAKMLRIHQPDASLLLRGQITRFSIARLMQFADSLQLAVRLTVVPKLESQKGEKTGRIPMRKTVPRRPEAKQAASPKTGRRAASA